MPVTKALLNLVIPLLFVAMAVLGLIIGISLYLSAEYRSKIEAVKDVAKTSTPF